MANLSEEFWDKVLASSLKNIEKSDASNLKRLKSYFDENAHDDGASEWCPRAKDTFDKIHQKLCEKFENAS